MDNIINTKKSQPINDSMMEKQLGIIASDPHQIVDIESYMRDLPGLLQSKCNVSAETRITAEKILKILQSLNNGAPFNKILFLHTLESGNIDQNVETTL